MYRSRIVRRMLLRSFSSLFSRSSLFGLLGLLGALGIVGGNLVAPSASARADEAEIRAALLKKVTLEFHDIPLREAVDTLEKKLDVTVRLNSRSLEVAGIDLDKPCSLKLTDVSARSSLNQLTQSLELNWRVRRWGVELLTNDELTRWLSTEVYDVSDLVPAGAGPQGALEREHHEYELRQVIKFAGALIPDVGWIEDGGAGRLSIDAAGMLTVTSTGAVHEEVERLLQSLRTLLKVADGKAAPDVAETKGALVPKGGPSAQPTPGGKGTAEGRPATTARLPAPTEREAALLNKLSQKVDADFEAARFVDAVEILERRAQVPIVIDRRALDEHGIDRETPVTLSIKDVRLDEVLELAFGPLELTFIIRDETIVLTTQEECERAAIVRFYPVGDFAPTENSYVVRDLLDDLSQLIQRHTGAPTPGWTDEGGVGEVQILSLPKALAVSTTEQVHREIEQLLKKLRAARGSRPIVVPTEPRIVKRRYPLAWLVGTDPSSLTPEQALALVKLNLVEFPLHPQRHVLQIVGDSVVLCHMTDVHRILAIRLAIPNGELYRSGGFF